MADKPFLLLINESFKSSIVSLPSADKNRLREKLEFLENGMWDSGVRVKKLKLSSNQVVFEARLNQGDRMLFTLGRDYKRSIVYVWGIYHHDDVNTEAKRIGLPENASFLYLESDDTEELPELLIEDLPREYMTQEAIYEKAKSDYGPQKWLVADTEELERLLRSNPDEGIELYLHITPEQKDILDQSPPLLISGTAGSGKTTISVYYLLAGERTGKKVFITCSSHLKKLSEKIYDGLVANRKTSDSADSTSRRPEFYTFREILEAVCKTSGQSPDSGKEVDLQRFTEIFANHSLARKYDAELVWEEIRAIVKGATPALSARRLQILAKSYTERNARQREISELCGYLLSIKALSMFRKIDRVREKKTGFANYDAFVQALANRERGTETAVIFLLEQAVRQVEARASAFDKPMLSFEDYEYLGAKRAPSFKFDRRDIYSVAEYYQQKIKEMNLWDEIDLTRLALREMSKKEDSPIYDLVVCDEIQDLADIQLSFLFRLAKHPSGLVLAGDPKQIINPSGFRWEEVRNRFYERGVDVPDVFRLNLNFRCVGSIVRLANALLDLKQRTVGISGTELREEWKFNGRPPYLLYGMDDEEVLKSANLSGAGRIILTRSNSERDKLKRRLATEMVFTIGEAKGLEFDTVLLWRFTESDQTTGIWRRILRGDPLEEAHHPHIRHEINLLYVAVTRSRSTLIIYDGTERNEVWSVEELAAHLFPDTEIQALDEAWRKVSTPDEWERQGDYFYERKFYRHATECYKNGGTKEKELLARAWLYQNDDRHKDAAKLFEEIGLFTPAAECHAKDSNWKRAAELYGKAGNERKRDMCRAELAEISSRWTDAATLWETLGEHERMMRSLEKGGEFSRLAELRLEKGDISTAATLFERAKDFTGAAECHLKLENYTAAADLLYKTGDFEHAMRLYRQLNNYDKELLCYRRLKRYYDAALLCEQLKNLDEAIEYFRAFAQSGEEQRMQLLKESKKPRLAKWKAAVRYSALGMNIEAAEHFRASRLVDEAVQAYLRAGEHVEAAQWLSENRRYRDAISALEAAKEPDYDLMHEIYCKLLGKRDQTSGPYSWNKTFEELQEQAVRLLRKGNYRAALARAKAIDDEDLIINLYEELGEEQEALIYFLQSGNYDSGLEYLDEIVTYDFDLDFILELVSGLESGSNQLKYSSDLKIYDLLSAVLLRALDLHGLEALGNEANNWLSVITWHFFGDDIELPRRLTDLLLRLRSYNTIVNIFHQSKSFTSGDIPEAIIDFARNIQDVGVQTGDDVLTACASLVLSPAETDTLIDKIKCDISNANLIACGPRYREAVDVLVAEKRFDSAITACYRNKDYLLLAELFEKTGDPKRALRTLLENGKAKEALEFAERVKDEVGMARAYEHLDRYEEALEIWEKRGNKRDAARMRKKLPKVQPVKPPKKMPEQGELF